MRVGTHRCKVIWSPVYRLRPSHRAFFRTGLPLKHEPYPNPLLFNLILALVLFVIFAIPQDVLEELDPSIEPVLSKAIIKQGNREVVRLGDKELDWSHDFRLYITTKLGNPHYTPEVTWREVSGPVCNVQLCPSHVCLAPCRQCWLAGGDDCFARCTPRCSLNRLCPHSPTITLGTHPALLVGRYRKARRVEDSARSALR